MIDIPGTIAKQLGLPRRSVDSAISLLDEGCTIPFISRYRKECTGSLNEVEIRDIDLLCAKLRDMEKRKEHIIATIEQAGALTPELKAKIEDTEEPAVLEDLYLPYRPKRRTRATAAREKGLEPLAKIIMAQNAADVAKAAARYTGKGADTADEAIDGACDIIAEWVSEHRLARQQMRSLIRRRGSANAKIARGKTEDDAAKYTFYRNFSKPPHHCSSHHVLAMLRGRSEGLLSLSISVPEDEALDKLNSLFVKKGSPADSASLVRRAVADSYERLLMPSIENETWAQLKAKADDDAIALFADNLRQLLMAAPLGSKRVMGIDPGIRTGCKVVCLDEQGNLLYHDVVFPQRERSSSSLKLARWVDEYSIDAIAVGNGTGGRETEQFLRIIHFPRPVEIYVVNESGASVYSASDLARQEMPDQDVTVRGAVSIGRRLIDPLAELVKIDPKSIGVGQYQHDVDQAALKDSLDFTVMSCVNQVGVNVNTASARLLSYISGIGPQLASNIVEYRAKNGDFASRSQLMHVPRMGAKAFQQAAGFLRIPGAKMPLDNSAVHPESYPVVMRMAADLGVEVEQLVGNEQLVAGIDLARYATDSIGMPTLQDIAAELKRPGRDPRGSADDFAFDPSVSEIGDLTAGMELPGIVNNITAFGAFVDIGVHESGLVHISQLSDKRVDDPRNVVKINQRVRVKVLEVDLKRRRISLTMKNVQQ